MWLIFGLAFVIPSKKINKSKCQREIKFEQDLSGILED